METLLIGSFGGSNIFDSTGTEHTAYLWDGSDLIFVRFGL